MRKIDKIIIHCSATKPSMDVGVKEINQWHKQRGWDSIGYHYVIRRNGQIEKGRDESIAGAHCRGYNQSSIGICYVGGVAEDGKTPEDTRTEEQKRALVQLVRTLKRKYPMATIHGHNEFAKKACPSFDVQKWLTEVYI